MRAGREWMLANYPILDPKRVGIVGWSHGGVIALMNIFEHPNAYAAAYAGVPVSDLVSRLGYKSESYRRDFSAPYHIGKDVAVLEVTRLIAALKAEGKTFESKIYQAAPGGHAFNRLDTKLARE